MNPPLQFAGLEQADLPARPLHLAIGMFDGVHLGHQAVIAAATAAARQDGGLAAVLTFWPHPSIFFRAGRPVRLLMTPEAKARILGGLGIAAIITQTFTPEFAGIAAEDFLPLLRRHLPKLAGVYVGDNWRFGRGRTGDAALLRRQGAELGLKVLALPRLEQAGAPISSTRIRELVSCGDMKAARQLLGRPYFAEGTVAPGRQLGRQLGFPTLNIAWAPDLQPRYGVYVVEVGREKSSQPRRGVANYGLRPTVEETKEPRLEVHVLGECPFGPGDTLRVDWMSFVRPEQKFPDLPALRVQIERDLAVAAAYAT
ncbi:MAG: riboflavin biosynthesis protein RibF [Opitutaceae bacterium]|nr:riboflavin biosynthesis protein RibF [Opitutaceae bacterium]